LKAVEADSTGTRLASSAAEWVSAVEWPTADLLVLWQASWQGASQSMAAW